MTKIYSLLIVILIISSCQQGNENEIVSPVRLDGKYGYIDIRGDWYIKPKFDSVGIFYAGKASSYQNDKEGIIDSKGNLIVDYKFDFIGHFEDERGLVVMGDSINYIDSKGDLISKRFYFDGEDFSEGLAPVQLEDDGKWGYLNKSGEIAIKFSYDYAQEFKNNSASVDLGEFEFLINKQGQILDTIESEYQKRKFPIIGSANVWKLGMLNSRGDTIMQMKYRSFGYPQGDLMWYFTGEKYGLADTTGTILIESIYDKLTYFSDNGLALASKDGKYGYIKKDGSIHIEFQYLDAKGFKYVFPGDFYPSPGEPDSSPVTSESPLDWGEG